LLTYVDDWAESGSISLNLLRQSIAATPADVCRRIDFLRIFKSAGMIMIFFLKKTTNKKGPISFLKFPVFWKLFASSVGGLSLWVFLRSVVDYTELALSQIRE
jgi:hypothetical protein